MSPGQQPQPVPPIASPLSFTPALPVAQIQSVIDGAQQTAGAMALQVIQYIVSALEQAIAGSQQTVAKIVTPITSAVNQVVSNVQGMQQSVQSQIQGQLLAATSGSGGTAAQGVKPGDYENNLYAYGPRATEAGRIWERILVVSRAQVPSMNYDWYCFVGGFEDASIAYAFASDPKNLPVTGSCPHPGGLVVPPTGNVPIFPQQPGSGAPSPSPPPAISTPAIALPPSTGPVVKAGPPVRRQSGPLMTPPCPADGSQPTYAIQLPYDVFQTGSCYYWTTCGNTLPQGSKILAGPFPDMATVVAYIGTLPPITCPSGPPVNQPPPCDPSTDPTCQPIGSPPICPPCPPCPPPCPQIVFPDCIKIDLCDWQPFKDALYDALCRWYNECVCKLANETAYVYEGCEGGFGQQLQEWMGDTAKRQFAAETIDDLVKNALGLWQSPPQVGVPP